MLPEIKDNSTKRALDLQKEGLPNTDIMNTMQRERFNPSDISSGIDQATVKNEIAPTRAPLNLNDVPSPPVEAPMETKTASEIPQQEQIPRRTNCFEDRVR